MDDWMKTQMKEYIHLAIKSEPNCPTVCQEADFKGRISVLLMKAHFIICIALDDILNLEGLHTFLTQFFQSKFEGEEIVTSFAFVPIFKGYIAFVNLEGAMTLIRKLTRIPGSPFYIDRNLLT